MFLVNSSEGISLSALFHISSHHPLPSLFFFTNQICVFLSLFLKNPSSILPITCHFYATLWRGRLSLPPRSSVFQMVLMYIGTPELLCLGRHSGLNSLLCSKPVTGVEFILILLPSLVLPRLIHLGGSETSAADGQPLPKENSRAECVPAWCWPSL